MSYHGELSPVLKQADVTYVSEEVCKSQYKTINFNITSSMTCAGAVGIGGIDSCQGDSGGKSSAVFNVPLYIFSFTVVFFTLKVH